MSKFPINRVVFLLQKRFFRTKNLHKPPLVAAETTVSKPIVSDHVQKTSDNFVTAHPLSSSSTVQYLMNSCGLPLKSAISASKKVQLEEKNKTQYDSVVSFLKSNKFTDTHVAKLLEKSPAVLCSRISTTLEPKIKFLVENGVPNSIVPKVIISNPALLFRSLDAQLKPAVEFLKEYVSCNDKLLVIIDRGSWILTCDIKKNLQCNIDFLIEQGVPKNRIGELLVLQPRCLYCQDVKRLAYAVDMVKSIGVDPNAVRFIHILRAVLSLSESSWKRKVETFRSLGWSHDDVISTLVRSPLCFSCSEQKLKGIMNFLVNTVKIDPKIIIGYPKLLKYSLKQRIVPRYTIWKILQERQLIPVANFLWELNKSEEIFIDQFITRFSDEIPLLRSIYDIYKKMQRVSAYSFNS